MKKIRIMLVDDNPYLVNSVKEYLNNQKDIEVVAVCQTGQEAIRLVNEIDPDILLLDLMLPGMNGNEALPVLHCLRPNLGIVILSLLEPETYRPSMLALGADEFVHKEELSSRLLEVIRSVYQKHQVKATNS